MESRNSPPRRLARLVLTLMAALGAVLLGAVPSHAGPIGAGDAQAAASNRYFVLIPGTCDGANTVYDDVDLAGGIPLKVHYVASAPGACGEVGYNDSVAEGHRNAKAVIEQAYRNDPGGQFVVVGYSQGAQVANLLLEDIADGRSIVPTHQVAAKIYADPMQPGTGIGATIPEGVGAPFGGYVSPGAGRTDFNGIPYIRYCIESDGVCDNRNPLESLGGYFAQHFCYEDHVMWTIADGVYSNATHFWPRINCRPPWPLL